MAPQIKVEVYRSRKDLEKGLQKYAEAGWKMESTTSTRRPRNIFLWRFSRKQIHNVTFTREI